MNVLASLGLILLIALLAGHAAKVFRVPEVTGYLLAGVFLGPSSLGWISADNLLALEVLAEVALGLILFSIGSVFEWSRFSRTGRQLLALTLVESALASVLVMAGALLLGQPWQIAFLLGAIAIETAPASTLMVVRECRSAGPLTDSLLGVIAINNVLCLAAYVTVCGLIDVEKGLGSAPLVDVLYQSGFPVFWQLGGSAALGYLVGLLLAGWSRQVTATGEVLTLLVGSILFCVGASGLLDLSPLIASLALGATMVNVGDRQRNLFGILSTTDPPFYAIFFVIAGAGLNLSLVWSIGALGGLYMCCRVVGKVAGARVGSAWLRCAPTVQQFLGFALIVQAGLAVGLSLAVQDRYHEYAPVISTVVLASVVVFEVIGPLSTRLALVRAGEVGRLAAAAVS